MARRNMIRFAVVLPFLIAFFWMVSGNGLHSAITLLAYTGLVCWLLAAGLYFLEE